MLLEMSRAVDLLNWEKRAILVKQHSQLYNRSHVYCIYFKKGENPAKESFEGETNPHLCIERILPTCCWEVWGHTYINPPHSIENVRLKISVWCVMKHHLKIREHPIKRLNRSRICFNKIPLIREPRYKKRCTQTKLVHTSCLSLFLHNRNLGPGNFTLESA